MCHAAATDDRPVLVTGANGFIGSHLAEELVRRGRRVRALVRRTSDLRWLDPRVEIVHGDVTRPLTLPAALAGVGTVFHVAGVVATHRGRTWTEVNAEGARNLALAVRKAAPGAARFLLVSSLAAAGPAREGRPVRECDPPRPVSRYGWSKLLGERAVAEAAGTLPVTVIRPPIVYGPRDRDLLTFFELVGSGFAPRFRREKYYSIVHVRDLVRGILAAAEAPGAAGRTYHLADGKAWSLSALLALIAGSVGARPRRLPVPEALLRLVGPLVDGLAPALGLRARPIGDKVREILPDHWVADTTRARVELGFRAEVPLRDGLAETAASYRDLGWIPGAV